MDERDVSGERDGRAAAGHPDLQLYYRPTCPFCVRVLHFMRTRGIEVGMHDISASEADRAFLVERGGKQQVPCLFVDGVALYESADIIAYLDRELS